MDKKRILGLLLFGCLVIAGMFFGASLLVMPYETQSVRDESLSDACDEPLSAQNEVSSEEELVDRGYANPASESLLQTDEADELSLAGSGSDISDNDNMASGSAAAAEYVASAGHISSDGADIASAGESTDTGADSTDIASDITPAADNNRTVDDNRTANDKRTANDNRTANDSRTDKNVSEAIEVSGNLGISEPAEDMPCLDLIYDCTKVDYMSYIPAMVTDDSKLETALDIDNPSIDIDASAAILFNVNSGEVLFYKDPVKAVFPASTAKLLTALVALDWCREDEEVLIGNEIKMVASDSTKARIKCGQVLTIRNLLEGMLLPSGNDAAYSIAAYVGRKSLKQDGAKEIEWVEEFVRLMNEKAVMLGAVNSCFKTPDGYDAIGQYTTAYDMGLIGLEAVKNDTIVKIAGMSSARNVFVSGEDVTWENTNSLINRYSGRYYAPCFGLKTGTSTMAGRCIIAVGKKSGRVVLCVIMDSTAQGRWEDAIKLMNYGLGE